MRLSYTLAGLALMTAAATAAMAAPADATVQPHIGAVPCNSSPPAPINFSNGTITHCFGGTVGTVTTDFWATGFAAGGYYGKYLAQGSGGDFSIPFKPGDSWSLNGEILNVTITPPF